MNSFSGNDFRGVRKEVRKQFFPPFFLKDITAPRQRRLARRVTSGKGLKQKTNSSRSTKTQIRAALQELLESLPDRMWRELIKKRYFKKDRMLFLFSFFLSPLFKKEVGRKIAAKLRPTSYWKSDDFVDLQIRSEKLQNHNKEMGYTRTDARRTDGQIRFF